MESTPIISYRCKSRTRILAVSHVVGHGLQDSTVDMTHLLRVRVDCSGRSTLSVQCRPTRRSTIVVVGHESSSSLVLMQCSADLTRLFNDACFEPKHTH